MSAPGILVIGASGFVGRAVVDLMERRGIGGVAVSRRGLGKARGCVRDAVLAYSDREGLARAASGCDSAILLAGRAHVMNEKAADPAAAFLEANCDLPLSMAEALAVSGVRRLLFVSSIAVNGVATQSTPFRESDAPAPVSNYGVSKLAGEQALRDRCHQMGQELVILRPPLVYGPEAPGNFGQLLRAAKRGIPLPLGSVHNRRDFIGLDNLADLLLLCARDPAAAGQTFLVSDGAEISTASLVRTLYGAAGHGHRIFPCPPALIRAAATVAGRPQIAAQLLDDLRIDASHLAATLGWRAPVGVREGLERSLRRTA